MRFTISLVLGLALPSSLLAVGPEDTPPAPSPTTQSCAEGTIWDPDSEACVDPEHSDVSDRTRMRAVRELAYAGQIDGARVVLDTLTDQSAEAAMTYRGFISRKAGDAEAALIWYREALLANPDAHLARSYMGQGFAEAGDIASARAQLREIRARGGRGTWAEVSLRLAIESGRGFSY